jgi:hypothetical protein
LVHLEHGYAYRGKVVGMFNALFRVENKYGLCRVTGN